MEIPFIGYAPISVLFWPATLGYLLSPLLLRAIDRLPWSKSMLWPISAYCRRCLQRTPWTHRLPIVGYFISRRTCPFCGVRQSGRLVLIPLLAILAFELPYLWHVAGQARFLPMAQGQAAPFAFYEPHQQAIANYHALLFCFLLAATFIDLDWMIIPDSITIPGMLVGILLGTFWYVELHPIPLWPASSLHPSRYFDAVVWRGLLTEGGPLPVWLEQFRSAYYSHWNMNWNRWVGLATSVTGLVVGGATVWVIRWLSSLAFRREAMGFGDVTLMAMVGSYLGWQTTILAFVLAPFSALVVGPIRWLVTGRNALPFGPHLSIGTAVCVLCWRPIWEHSYIYFSQTVGVFAALVVGLLTAFFISAQLVQWGKNLIGRLRNRQTPLTSEPVGNAV